MNPEHEMLMDKLKGHTYKMSRYHYMEVQLHIDPELSWIISTIIDEFRKEPTNFDADQRYRVLDLFKVVAPVVASAISERENSTVVLHPNEAADVMMKAYRQVTAVNNKTKTMEEIVYTSLPYLISVALGKIRYLDYTSDN